MSRRLSIFLAACALTVPAAVAAPLTTAFAAPSSTGLTARNVAVCPTPQNVDTARCHAILHELVDSHGKPVNNNTTPSGYRPSDLQSAYNLDGANGPSATYGARQTIAIVDAYDDPNAASDLNTYRTAMGLPTISTSKCSLSSTSPCFVKVNQNGVAGSYPRSNGGWAQEISLDLDMASAICPNCNILLVEASSSSFTNLGTAVATAAKLGAVAISNSYGSSGDVSDSSYGQYYDHPGIAVAASTGDSGYGVGYPATSDYTIAVGGTTLTQAKSTRGWSESAWSGAGSGCSTYQAEPSFQSDYGLTACGSKRAIADVSADANPNTGVAVYDSYSYQGLSGWLVFGGTSVSSPIIASVYALAKGSGLSLPSYPAQVPYGHTSALNDVTQGSNGTCSTTVLCTAGSGWDGPTGLGTPDGVSAFGTSGSGGITSSTPTASFTYSCTTNLACTFTDTSTDSGSTIDMWSWTFGDGGTSTTQSPSHTYSAGGTYTVRLTVTDANNQTASTSESVAVSSGTGIAPAITGNSCSGATCTFDATGSPTLTWNFGLTGSPASYTFSSPGGYTVTVSNSYGSASTSVSCGWNGHGKTKSLTCS